MVTCYDCKGEGYTLFLNNESTCKACGGEGTLTACDAFARDPLKVIAFRNQPCYKCGVRENDHNTVGASA